jgi:hypothetical protein
MQSCQEILEGFPFLLLRGWEPFPRTEPSGRSQGESLQDEPRLRTNA